MTRLAYLGTPTMSVPPLRALVDHGFDIAAVVTRVDKRRGRGGAMMPSPVKEVAVELGLPVVHRVDDLLDPSIDPPIDLGVVVAFGQLIKPHVLTAVPMVNLHFSLLPRWRGAAPVERALLAGDEVTGVCLMELEEGLDTGPVYERVEVPIGTDETADELRAELVRAGTDLLIRRLTEGLGTAQPQVGDPSYASKLSADELRIDWTAPPVQVHRLVRLGGAWTTLRCKRLRIVAAELVGDVPGAILHDGVVGGLRLRTVQPEGKGPMPFADFARGARLATDEQLD